MELEIAHAMDPKTPAVNAAGYIPDFSFTVPAARIKEIADAVGNGIATTHPVSVNGPLYPQDGAGTEDKSAEPVRYMVTAATNFGDTLWGEYKTVLLTTSAPSSNEPQCMWAGARWRDLRDLYALAGEPVLVNTIISALPLRFANVHMG